MSAELKSKITNPDELGVPKVAPVIRITEFRDFTNRYALPGLEYQVPRYTIVSLIELHYKVHIQI